ncbi:acyloxyacyl hydrolase, partial [bacterium]
RGFGVALSVLRPERQANFRGYRGEVKYELNFLTSTSPGLYEYDADRTEGYGALALYRLSRYREGQGIYLEAGLGVQYSSQATHDARLQLNTTPTFGVGYRFPVGERAIEIGARYYHVSNAGRKNPNGGQNWLFATVSFAF